jgi:hypothetical protein
VIVFAAVFSAMILGAVYVAPRLFVLFDEAYNLNVSQTLAERGVYASHLAEGDRLFDPAVTTGPALLVPLALAVRLGGADLTVVRAALLVIFIAGLVVVFFSAWELLGGPWPALAFLIVYYGTRLVLMIGLSVLGEVLAIDLMLAALALLHRAERPGVGRRSWLLLASGLALGMAELSKDMISIVAVVMAMAWLWDAARGRARRSLPLLAPALVAAAVAGAWRAVQILGARLTLSPDALQAWNRYAAETARNLWTAVTFGPLSHPIAAVRLGIEYFGPILLGLSVAFAALAVARLLAGERTSPLDGSFTHRVIVITVAILLFWYVLISGPQALHKHVLPAIVLGELFTVLVTQWLWRMPRLVPRLVALALAVLLAYGVVEGMSWNRLYLSSSQQRLALEHSAATWIAKNTPADAAISGWGWFVPWHIAFLAHRTPAQAHVETDNLAGLSDWFVVSAEIPWSNYKDDRLADFLRRQGAPVVNQPLYPVYRVTWRP